MSISELKRSNIIELLNGSVNETLLSQILSLLKDTKASEAENNLPAEVLEGIRRGENQIKKVSV